VRAKTPRRRRQIEDHAGHNHDAVIVQDSKARAHFAGVLALFFASAPVARRLIRKATRCRRKGETAALGGEREQVGITRGKMKRGLSDPNDIQLFSSEKSSRQ